MTDGQTDGRTDGQNYDSQDCASIAALRGTTVGKPEILRKFGSLSKSRDCFQPGLNPAITCRQLESSRGYIACVRAACNVLLT